MPEEISHASTSGTDVLDLYHKLRTDPACRPLLAKIGAKRVRRCQSAVIPDSPSGEPKVHFIDVPSTGMRLAYHEYLPRGYRGGRDGLIGASGDGARHARGGPHRTSQTSDKVVILLHDRGSSSAVWHDVATELADSGVYTVIALDSRGHGRSTWSGQYTLELMARDVHGFIVQKNLYTRPVCVIGIGMGGLVGIMLAGMSGKKLVGAVGVVEAGLVLGEAEHGGPGQPWVGEGVGYVPPVRSGSDSSVGHVAPIVSTASLAMWLENPLSGMGPRLVRMVGALMEYAESKETDSEGRGKGKSEEQDKRLNFLERQLETLLEYETGDQRQCMRLARALVREDGRGACTQRADPGLVLRFSQEEIRKTLNRLDMHVLFMFGEFSAMSSRQDVCRLSSLCTSAESVTVEELPDQSSRFVRDNPDEATDAILEYIAYTATGCFDVPKGDMWARTPANLGLRPLDEYESLEAAKKALGARKVPTRQDIEEALRKLRVEEGRDPDDVSEDEDVEDGTGSATALCHDSKNYFGFVG